MYTSSSPQVDSHIAPKYLEIIYLVLNQRLSALTIDFYQYISKYRMS